MKKMRFKKTVLAVALGMTVGALCYVPVATSAGLLDTQTEAELGRKLSSTLAGWSDKALHERLFEGGKSAVENIRNMSSSEREVYIASLKEIRNLATSDALIFKPLPNGKDVGAYGFNLDSLVNIFELANKLDGYADTAGKFLEGDNYEERIINSLTAISEIGVYASDELFDKTIGKVPIIKDHPLVEHYLKEGKNLIYYGAGNQLASDFNGFVDAFSDLRDGLDKIDNYSAYNEIDSLMVEYFAQTTSLQERYLGEDIVNRHLSKEVMALFGANSHAGTYFQYFDEHIGDVLGEFEDRRAYMLERLTYLKEDNARKIRKIGLTYSEKLDTALTNAIAMIKSTTRESQSNLVRKLEPMAAAKIDAAVDAKVNEALVKVMDAEKRSSVGPAYQAYADHYPNKDEFRRKLLNDLLAGNITDSDLYATFRDEIEKFFALLEYDTPEDLAKTDDDEEPIELEDKKRKDEKEIAKLIDETKNDLKVDETKTLETNFYERTLAKFDVDIFFLADNTGSMVGLINSVQTHAQGILDGLRADPRFAKVNAQFGVGSYQDDPREPSTNSSVTGDNGHDASYWLHQAITDNDQDVIDALSKWEASGGNGYIEEGNFYAIHQVITEGEAVRGNESLSSGHKTGWRKEAAKVIVVFGDRQSWQTSINEKELKALARAMDARIVFIDTNEMNDSTYRRSAYDANSGSQMQDAAVEIADASGGSYMKLTNLDKIKDAVLDSVYDALADNTWQGGMLARMGTGAGNQWRVRTPSSVTATSADEGKTLNFVLRYPNQPTSGFVVDTTSKTRVKGTEYYEGVITDFGYTYKDTDGEERENEGIFGKDFSAGSSVFHTNDNNSFMRFVLRDGSHPERPRVIEGYYGERLTNKAKLPPSANKTISSYDMRHRVINPSGSQATTAAGAMKLFVNWTGEDVYGIETNARLAGGTGTALFIGKRTVDRDRTEIGGSYLFKTREISGSPLVIRDAARDTTTLQMYGKNGAEGLGGTFGAVFDGGASGLSSMMMSGFRNQALVKNTDALVRNDTWKGYAAGWVRDGGAVKSAFSSNPDEVQIALRPALDSVTANVNMRIDGTGASVGFANAGSEVDGENIYITKDAFVAVKDIHGTPSYVAAAGKDDGLDYLTWGVWSVESTHTGLAGATVLDGSHWIAGTMTQTHDMPTTGTASYAGQVHGTAYEKHPGSSGGNGSSGWATPGMPDTMDALTGTIELKANFATGNIGGSLNVNYADTTKGAYAIAELGTVEIRNGNQFGGPLGGDGNMTGNIHGAFYGPGAAEVGGNWDINKDSNSQATGVFTGKKE